MSQLLTVCLEPSSSHRCPDLGSPTPSQARTHGYHYTPRLSRRSVSVDRYTRCPILQRLSRPHFRQWP